MVHGRACIERHLGGAGRTSVPARQSDLEAQHGIVACACVQKPVPPSTTQCRCLRHLTPKHALHFCLQSLCKCSELSANDSEIECLSNPILRNEHTLTNHDRMITHNEPISSTSSTITTCTGNRDRSQHINSSFFNVLDTCYR